MTWLTLADRLDLMSRQHPEECACGCARGAVPGERRDKMPLGLPRSEGDVPHLGRKAANHTWHQRNAEAVLDESEEKRHIVDDDGGSAFDPSGGEDLICDASNRPVVVEVDETLVALWVSRMTPEPSAFIT